MAKMVFCFLLAHRKWGFGKIQRFPSTEKRNLFATNQESALSDSFCNSKDLFFIKASYLESQQKPTSSKDKKGPQERSCLSLCPLTFHNKPNTDRPLPHSESGELWNTKHRAHEPQTPHLSSRFSPSCMTSLLRH